MTLRRNPRADHGERTERAEQTCPRCNGTGDEPRRPGVRCIACRGAGTIMTTRLVLEDYD